MKKNLKTLLLIPSLLPLWAFAQNTSVQVLETHPPARSMLSSGEPMYVRLAYKSDVPVRFKLSGSAGGAELEPPVAGPTPLYPAGSGQAIAWIAYRDRTHIDELRVTGLNEQSEMIHILIRSWDMRWSEVSTEGWPAPAEWVRQLLSADPMAVGSLELPPAPQPPQVTGLMHPSFYSDWFWLLQLGVLLAGVLFAWWLDSSSKPARDSGGAGNAG